SKKPQTMGMDIDLWVNNYKEVITPEFFKATTKEGKNPYKLSRSFFHFMNRWSVVPENPYLDQIGRITSVDIQLLYDMEKYWDEPHEKVQLTFAETEQQQEEIRERIQADRKKVEGNIDLVTKTINNLIDKLSQIDNLPQLLDKGGEPSYEGDNYFSDFN